MIGGWKIGMRRLAPGLYVTAKGVAHIDAKEFLEEAGVPSLHLTEDNKRLVQEFAHMLAREMGAELHE